MIINNNVDDILDDILKINNVLTTTISSYEGLVIKKIGVEVIHRKKLTVEIAKIAKSIREHLPKQLKHGITLSVYFDKFDLLIVFFENFIISVLCDRDVNMGFLKIKMRKIIPLIKSSL